MKQKVMKIGNSIGVTVPADFIQSVGVRVGDEVVVRKNIGRGEITYKFSGIQQLAFPKEIIKGKRRKNI